MGNTADSGGGNTGFRCASGRGGGKRHAPLNQEAIAAAAADGGIDAVREMLAASGHSGASVMTAAELRELQANRKGL